MTAGFNLKEGTYVNRQLTDDEMWSAFAYLFSSKSVNDTSYKFGFLKSILDNLYNVDEAYLLTFDQLFGKFAEIYWNLVLKYQILQKNPGKQNRRSALERVLIEAQENFGIEAGIPYENLPDDVAKVVNRQVKQKCKLNVVGALYGDLGGLFYSFSVKEGWIRLNPQMYDFVCKHKVTIEKVNYYEWARFLEKVNTNAQVDHLLSKLEESTKRRSLSYYRDVLFQEFEQECFYCGKRVSKDSVHVDHFIPWSFIKDDNYWNFVLACPKCNGDKRDKLADAKYLDLLIKRNGETHYAEHFGMRESYSGDRLKAIYQWAQNNGYNDIWAPKVMSKGRD